MMRFRSPLLLAVSVLLPCASPANPEKDFVWPGWRGPDRDARAKNFQVPAEWPKKLTQLWRSEVGTGYGTPIVVGDKILQHARMGDEEVVSSLDLKSGELQWRKSYPVSFKIGSGGQRHGKGPKSSPVYADGLLFTLSITGILSAWDAESGELLWRRDFAERFEPNHPYWGVATSPLVDENRLIVRLGTCDAGSLFALDVASGKEIWSQGAEGTCYSSPILIEIAGVRQIVEWNHDGLTGIDSRSGRVLWAYSFPHLGNNQNTPTPVFHDGRIIAGGENRGMRSIEPRRIDGEWTVRENWRHRDVSLEMSTPVINGDLLYGFSHFKLGQLFCLNPATGKVLWYGPPRTGDNVALLSARDHVFALIDTGELRILRATGDAYRLAASYRVAERETWAPPVLLEDGVLVKDKNHLARWKFGEAKAR